MSNQMTLVPETIAETYRRLEEGLREWEKVKDEAVNNILSFQKEIWELQNRCRHDQLVQRKCTACGAEIRGR